MYAKVIGYAAVALLAAILAGVTTWEIQAGRIATLQASYAKAAQVAEVAARATEKQWADAATAQSVKINQSEKETNDKLQTLSADNDRLRACVAAGTCGLRYNTKPASAVPGAAAAPAAACTGDGSAGQLDDVARQAYFALRSGIEREAEKLKLCQSYINTLQ